MWRINWFVCVWILLLLLLCTIGYDWLHASVILLWIHGLHMLWLLPNAGNCWIPVFFTFCSPYIPIH
uniref:Uncharacterized protein n=1 Tax=Picea sitchensis TaxID=3332 RepID=A9NKA2_PICSI|nr:unknown [Picea sitchensis]